VKPTLYKTQGQQFSIKFDPQTGEETISLWAPKDCQHILNWLPEYDNPKDVLKVWSCAWIGRAADADRCTEVGMRVHDDGRIEIRLRFGPPWYWDMINGQSKPQSDQRDPVQQGQPSMV
jgi:hypothetical protein